MQFDKDQLADGHTATGDRAETDQLSARLLDLVDSSTDQPPGTAGCCSA